MDKLSKKTFATSRDLTYTYYVSPKTSGADFSKPTLLLCHGFPDDALMWEKVVPYLQRLPYPLLIPDLLGYSGTSKPLDPALYNSKDMAQDLCEILDNEGIKNIISTGHDWGSFMAARMWLWHPDRCVGMILLNVAYMPPDTKNPFDLDTANKMTEQMTGHPRLAYWYLLTAPDGPKLLLDKIEATWGTLHGAEPNWMERMFCVRDAMRQFLEGDKRCALKPYAQGSALHDRFVNRMKRDGFEAPVRWYFAMKDNHHYKYEKDIPPQRFKVTVPMLYIGCTDDAVCRTELIEGPKQAGLLPDLVVKELKSAHWCAMEVPDQVGEVMVEWLRNREKDLQAKL
jgi:soluble epoxide hydrolase / lipid-phosphate phosphatase